MDVDANSASKETLMSVKGIGEELAEAIIRMRPFDSLDGLLSVPGIGQKSLRHFKAQGLRATPAPRPEPEAARAAKGPVRREKAMQEKDEVSKGSLGDERTIAERGVYFEAPAGAMTAPREVEGFNKEGIKEYGRGHDPKQRK